MTRILAWNSKILRAKILARGSDDDVIKLTKKHAPIMIPLAQNPHQNLKQFFFILNYTTPRVITGFE